jgi:general secretion pathway protein F
MPVFSFKGVNEAGRSTRGFVDAENTRAARMKLRRDGVFLTELAENRDARTTATTAETSAPRRFSLSALRRIPPLELALATRQLATLLGAGVPLVSGLSALTEQVEHARLKSVLGGIRDRVNQGASFADSLAGSQAFPELYVALTRAGEAGGALEQVLARLADYLEGQVRLRNRVVSIMIYPALMFAFACVVVAILVTVVLPQITTLLESLNAELPFATRAIIALSYFARDWWWAITMVLIGAGFAIRTLLQSEGGRLAYDRLILRLPVVGRTVRLLSIARFSRTLSTLLSGGLPIVRALDIAKHVADNRILARAIDAAIESVTEGAPLARPLRASGEFPPVVIHMIEVGEQSGELEAMLERVAHSYEEQVETAVTRLTALLEPLLILLMVVIVVFIIAATLLPLLQVTSSLGA